VSPHVPYAAGGFCGTAGDLVAWNAELHGRRGGRLLPDDAYAEMTRPAVVAGDRRPRYGLGVGLGEIAGRSARHHGGDIDGFTTFTAYLPDDSLNVTVLINTQGPTRPDAVAAVVTEAALGRRRPATAEAPPGDLSRFAGAYGEDVVFTPIVAGGTRALRIERGPLPPAVLHYTGRDATGWTFSDGRARYTFEAAGVRGSPSPAVWADLGVSLVRWERAPRQAR
jgi:hypothetical protein